MIIDEAKEPRPEENLDAASIDNYLKSLDSSLTGEPCVRQYPSGASNLTYEISYPERTFVLRRPPLGKVAKSAHDMMRESNIIATIRPSFPYVPQVIDRCEDQSVLGCHFYVMAKLTGMIPRQDFPPELQLSQADTKALCHNVIDRLIDLHEVDYQKAGLSWLGRGEGYVARQINGWSDRYRKARTDDAASFEDVMTWLAEKQPGDSDTCVIHNDYRLDNLVFDPENPMEIIGILDWELATLGDPLMDLGNSLAYWVEASDDAIMQSMRRQPTHLPGMLTRQEVIEYYLSRRGLEHRPFDFYLVYGLFRLAGIIQQIYHRYYHGQTKDQRFAGFAQAGQYLEKRCLGMIQNSQL